MTAKAKVECEHCESWLRVPEEANTVECPCGAVFAVTVTRIATTRA